VCEPTPEGLQRITDRSGLRSYGPSVWIVANKTRLRTFAGVLGKEIAHVDRKPGKEVICVDVVEKHGEWGCFGLCVISAQYLIGSL
jgi:hypothetical protein